MLVVEPVVMAPLRREWEAVKADVEAQLDRRHKGKADTKKKADKAIEKTLRDFIDRLASIRILDPACGSGNFLYVAIQQLLHLEKEVITYAARPDIALGLFPQVRPTQLHGIEINPYAAELAQIVIWIGYLQWMRDNGFAAPRDPILEPLQTIECRDAILEFLPESVPEPPHLCGADSARRERRGSGMRERRGSEGRGGHYLLTWTTYGTWLPGDERGFVGRVPDEQGGHVTHNLPGEPYDADEPRLQREALRQRKGAPVKLTREQAGVCVEAFGEVCVRYGVSIDAGAVMANHLHLVVTSDESEGPRLLNLFKGVSSRRLGQRFGKQASGSWWTTGGSRRLLRDERAFENAVNYVRNQGHMLAACETPPPDMNVGARAIASDAIPNAGILPSPGVHASPSPGVHASPSPGVHASPSPGVHASPSPGVHASPSPGVHASPSPGVHAGRSQSIPRKPLAVPARWPDADFIIGNPPFLGSSLLRDGLSDDYVTSLYGSYELPKTSDLCCYWFEQARTQVGRAEHTRAGLLATQGIRGGDNRTVLERIKKSGDIFMAWSDRDWVLDGAAVHVSIIGFDGGREVERRLNGLPTSTINSDLTTGTDL
jgi:REP element-mobilizing transposase RayT